METKGGRWAALMARQLGVISRRQARECGLTAKEVRGLLERREWVRALPSVYRLAAASSAWPQSQMAAFLWARGKALVSHQAAAALWGLDGFWLRRVELSTVSALTAPEGVRLYRVSKLARADSSVRRGIGVTSVARTLLDLAGDVPPRTLERALDDAHRQQLVTMEQVRWCIENNGRRGREGVAHLELLIAERKGQVAPDSPLETTVWAMLREFELPTPVRKYRVVENGFLLGEVDLAWPKERVAVQVHGSWPHREPRTWEQDQETENLLLANGWYVAKATSRMLKVDAGRLALQLKAALTVRGQPTERALAAESSG